MTSYSSDQFFKDWRFAIDKDFVKPDGTPFEYAENGLQEWGQELLKFPFEPSDQPYGPKCCAISDDLKYIATASGVDIVVTSLDNLTQTHLLRGHVSKVDFLLFQPGVSSQLVSGAQNYYAGSKRADAQIILWDLNKHEPNDVASPESIERISRNAANSVVSDVKSAAKWTHSAIDVKAADQKALADELAEPISQLIISRSASKLRQLAGRLVGSFQSSSFSPSGSLLAYQPGNLGSLPRLLRVYSMDRHEDIMSFDGFTDNVMWIGFNHRETLLGAAIWDGTFRIWDLKTGVQKHIWETGKQNWTGGFSPNDRYFAGTSGDGHLHVYDLTDGSEHMDFDGGPRWCRALSWHPDSNTIALGTESFAAVYLIDINTKSPFQERRLSNKAMKGSELAKRCAGGFLTTSRVQYIEGGRKIVFFTTGDGSPEVYDLKDCVKWRFARAGTMNPPEDHSEVTSKAGGGVVVREDPANKRILLASIDGDAIRLWSVPLSS